MIHETSLLIRNVHNYFHCQPASSVPEVAEWIKQKEDYSKLWNQLSSSIKGSAIDPISLDCSLTANEILKKAISNMEGMHPTILITHKTCKYFTKFVCWISCFSCVNCMMLVFHDSLLETKELGNLFAVMKHAWSIIICTWNVHVSHFMHISCTWDA